MVIGNNNVFGISSIFSGARMGDACTLEARSHVALPITLGSNISIGPRCIVEKDLPGFNNFIFNYEIDCTVVYGENNEKRVQKLSGSETAAILHVKHLVRVGRSNCVGVFGECFTTVS